MLLTTDAFAAWLDSYKAVWEEQDSDRITSLFTEDAIYRETPFDEPMTGRDAIRDYWIAGAESAQDDITFGYDILAVTGNVGLCRWTARFKRIATGETIMLDGIFRCVYSPDGADDIDGPICANFEEWWHRRVV